MVNRQSAVDRCPLNEAVLRRAVIGSLTPGGAALWREFTVVAETASTNDDVAAAARAGADEGKVLVAESQTSGRGRHDREWLSPPCAGLTFSVLLRPAVPVRRWGWLPLLAGVAVAQAIDDECGLTVSLKWPNDVLLATPLRKAAGILATVVPTLSPALVVGIGLNVSTESNELPGVDATSLLAARGVSVDRSAVLVAVLRRLAAQYEHWQDHDGDVDSAGLREVYRRRCHTLDKRVKLRLPGGSSLAGQAMDVDVMGRLVVATATGSVPIAAGDVIGVR